MFIHSLNFFGNILGYLHYRFPDKVDSVKETPIVELDQDEWASSSFTGYGYLIEQEAIDNVSQQIQIFPKSLLERHRKTNPLINRDLTIFDIYQQKIKSVPFIIILGRNEGYILHEISHLIWRQMGDNERDIIDFPTLSDADEYMSQPGEQFSYLTEMDYFRSQGISFDDYFRMTFPREFRILNDPNADVHDKELAQMDYNDHRVLWHHKRGYNSNWLKKISQSSGLVLNKGVNTLTNRPIYYLTGPTYPIRNQLGRGGLGFTWYGAKKMWWMYADRMTPNILSSLQRLGVNVTQIEPHDQANPKSDLPEQVPDKIQTRNASMVDQTWDKADSKSRWYGFPVKDNIYSTKINVRVDDEDIELYVVMDRRFDKGTRRIPRYIFNISWNDKAVGRLAKDAPNEWGRYDENDIAISIPTIIQERLDKKGKSRLYASLKYQRTVSHRTPELTEFLKEYGSNRKGIIKTIHLDYPEYEGDYPVKMSAYNDGLSWSGETAIDHPLAPYPATLYFLTLPAEIHRIDEFNDWLDSKVNDPSAKERYLRYLKSFPFFESEQEEAQNEFYEILPIIQSHYSDPDFFRRKLLEYGYIRPRRRKSKGRLQNPTVPGTIQTQDYTEFLLDKKKIVDDSYRLSKLTHSPKFFYTVLAYMMHRQLAGNIGFGAVFGQIGTVIRDFHGTLKRYDAHIDINDLWDYIESLSKKLLREVIGTPARGSAWDNWAQFYGGDEYTGTPSLSSPSPTGGFETFVNFAIQHGLTEEQIRQRPLKAFRTLAKQFAPDLHPDDPQSEINFKRLYELWAGVPANQKTANSWFLRVIGS